MPAGRPFGTFNYKSEDELQKDIDAYFALQEERNKPPVMTGLALALGITPQTLCNYGNENYADGKYFETVNRARMKVLAYKEERLYDKDGVQGAKFDLINNSERMGGLRYADKQEYDMSISPITFVDDLGE